MISSGRIMLPLSGQTFIGIFWMPAVLQNLRGLSQTCDLKFFRMEKGALKSLPNKVSTSYSIHIMHGAWAIRCMKILAWGLFSVVTASYMQVNPWAAAISIHELILSCQDKNNESAFTPYATIFETSECLCSHTSTETSPELNVTLMSILLLISLITPWVRLPFNRCGFFRLFTPVIGEITLA